ncbi:MAG: DUF1064 domain-containing protein [Planctomycetes bacterium]|nr:DUF1064 domain-containing protein [Planctomycetota bacterium]
MSKYGNRKVELDNYVFDSQAEARRYEELKLFVRAEKISRLEIHPRFEIVVNERMIGKYHADFQYYDFDKREFVVEDVKGGSATKTEAYRLRKKLVEAIYNITITEVEA